MPFFNNKEVSFKPQIIIIQPRAENEFLKENKQYLSSESLNQHKVFQHSLDVKVPLIFISMLLF